MSGASITRGGTDRLMVKGDLDIHSAPALLEQGRQLLSGEAAQSVDLAGVSRIDSAGVALLLEWSREAVRRRLSIRFANVPEQVLAIARVCGVEQFLPR